MNKRMLVSAWLVALGLAACGGDAEPTPAATPLPEPSPTAVAQVEPTEPLETAVPPVAPPSAPTGTVTVAAASPVTVGVALADETEAPTATCAIEPAPDLEGYADLIPQMGCPIAQAAFEPVAINEFGKSPEYDRFMLWFSGENQIYVLLPDKTWMAYTDTWKESEPEILCNPDNLDPVTSPPLPRRGFGKLWCTVESVRETLGLSDREERLCQHSVVQRFENGRLLACFEDATIRYFRLLDDGAWNLETVQ